MVEADDVATEALVARRAWMEEHFDDPSTVYLPTVYANALLADFLDRIEDEAERARLAEAGLANVYGGTLFGMTIDRVEDGPLYVE